MRSAKFAHLLTILVLVLVVVDCFAAAQTVSTTPGKTQVPAEILPGTTLPVPPSAELTAAEQARQRLHKLWNGGDVAVIDNAMASSQEDLHDMVKRLNKKYGVFDPLFDATAGITRQDQTDDMSSSIIEKPSLTDVQEDYKLIYKSMPKKKDVNPVEDDPAVLESHLGALWGKRYAHMSEAVRQDTLRNENVLIIQGTSPSALRNSMAISTDGSVQSWVAHAESVDDEVKPPEDKPFKPSTQWFGPRVVADALDVTQEELDGHGREPSDPPKPPVESYVFAEPLPTDQDPENKITIIERITVTKPGTIAKDPARPEPTFTPIMVDKIAGPAAKAFIH